MSEIEITSEISAEEGILKIRKAVGRWLSPSGIKARTAIAHVANVLLAVRLPALADTPQEQAAKSLRASLEQDQDFTDLALLAQPMIYAGIYDGITDPDILVRLSSYVSAAEHGPGTWAETRQSMGGVCTASGAFDITAPFQKEDNWANFSFKRDAFLAVAAVNALPELMGEIRRLRDRLEVPTDSGTLDGIDTRQAVINVLQAEIVELRSALAEQSIDADGWISWAVREDCPVTRGTLVDVRYRNGKEKFSIPALEYTAGNDASIGYWEDEGTQLDIVAYRLSAPATPAS